MQSDPISEDARPLPPGLRGDTPHSGAGRLVELFNPRIRIIGVPTASLPEELRAAVPDRDDATPESMTPAETGLGVTSSPVSVRAVIDVGAPPVRSEPATIECAMSEPTPEPAESAGLDWDERESLTDVMPSWEDEDDLTMPRRLADLRAAMAAVDTLVDAPRVEIDPTAPSIESSGEPLVEIGPMETARGTLVDAVPPSDVAAIIADARFAIEDESDAPESEAPQTQPSSPPDRLSVEIDVLPASSTAFPSPPLLLDDGDDDLAPVAQRSPTTSIVPRLETLPPVAISNLPPPPAPRRSSSGSIAAIASALLAVCVAATVVLFFLRERDLAIRPIVTVLLPIAPAAAPAADPNGASVTPSNAPAKPAARGLVIELATNEARVVLVQGTDTRVLPGPFPQHLDLAPGSYKIVASRHGYEPFVEHVTVVADRESTVRIALEPEPSRRAPPSASVGGPPPGFDPNADPYE